MGLLRDVVTAFKPENVKRGLAAARTPATQAELDAAVAALPPEQRAAYEANQARVEQARAESEASWQAATALSDEVRVLDGPAGRALYGAGPRELGSPAEIEAQIAEQGVLGAVAAMRAKRKGEFRQALRQTFGIPEVAEVEDPEERRRIAAEERAARDAARAPYRAPAPAAVAISRLATRGETQVAEVLAFLRASGLAARPDRVFGVYRVPDRISGPRSPGSERGRVVEWDVVHEPVDPPAGAAAPSLVATSFLGDEQWVARRRGEPSVLDEDLALAFCAQAGIGPERCLGLARVAEFRSLRGEGSEDTAGPLRTLVRGMVAIHAEAFDTKGSGRAVWAQIDVADC
ncbi:MAG: hypothetical protein HZB46_07685, partial [Solirubrobacterales bacterium]|nr:hypothetical protein [Solirubrobacterales bacterium]